VMAVLGVVAAVVVILGIVAHAVCQFHFTRYSIYALMAV